MNRRSNGRHRSKPHYFGMIPAAILNSGEYAALSPPAVKLLLDLAGKYRGGNNGDLSMPWSDMKDRGWKSKDTLQRARNELLTAGFIVVSRRGGRRVCHLYALTFQSVDWCGGKLDIPETKKPTNNWKRKKTLAPVAGANNPDSRGNGDCRYAA